MGGEVVMGGEAGGEVVTGREMGGELVDVWQSVW